MTNSDPTSIQKKKQKLAGVFNRAAPSYDQVGPSYFSHFGTRLVELARLPRGAKVLDVATGRGAVLFPAARAVGPDGAVTGIDLAQEMLNATSLELQRLKLENITLQQMDAEHLDFEDESFDVVLSGLALLFFPQPRQALSEMRRVLKPHGHLAVSTWDNQGDSWWRWFEEDLYHAFMPPKAEDTPIPDPQAPPILELDTPEGLMVGIGSAGFTDVQVVAESMHTLYHSEQEWWDALWGTSCRQMLEEIDEAIGSAGLEKFRLAVFAHLKTIRQEDGIPAYVPILFAMARKPNS